MIKDLIQTKCPAVIPVILVCAISLLGSCGNRSSDSPPGYNIHKPRTTELGKVLNEISGIFYHNGDSSLLAISDNQEKIISISLSKRKLKDLTGKIVAKGSDVEDIVLVDSLMYILLSKGIIKSVPNGAQDSTRIENFQIPLEGSNDFETLYYDEAQNALIMMCKSCAHEKGKKLSTAYKFDLETRTFDTTALFTVSEESIAELMKDSEAKLAPSAAAIHPVNKQLYILSSAGNLLVVTDQRGKLAGAYKLNPDTFQQAEGIAFAPDGDMYISNEGKLGKPTLLFFPYTRQGKKNK